MDPISFPKQIRDYFQENPVETTADDARLTKIFQENGPARDDFIAWAKAHQSVVQHTPRLYKTLDLANDSPEQWEDMAKNINSLYLWYRDDGSSALIDKVLSQKDNGIDADIPANYASTVLELHESGVLNQDQVVKLLSTTFRHDLLPLQKKNVLESAIPFLDKLEPNFLVVLFSIQSNRYETLLHNVSSFALAIPLLGKLEYNDLIKLLSIQDVQGRGPAPSLLISKEALPILGKLQPKDLFNFFSAIDRYGMTPLHDDKIFKVAFPLLLNKLDLEDLVKLLTIEDNFKGKTPLHDPDIFQAAIPFLEKCDSETLIKLLSIKANNGMTPLHNKTSLEKAISLLDKMEPDALFNILSIKDKWGQIPVKYADLNKIISLLEKLDSETLFKLLSIQDDGGRTLLSDKNFMKKAIFLLEKLDDKAFYALLSIKDNKGNTPLHHEDLFKLALPFLKKIKPDDLIDILSIKNDLQRTPLGYPFLDLQRFKLALLLFQLMPDDHINQLFSIQDNKGNTMLHDPQLFEAAHPLLTRLKPSVFQIRNADGISVEESAKNRVSDKWLVKDKASVDLKPLSEEEYHEKSEELKKKLDILWNSFVFGEEEDTIPKEYLNLIISNTIKSFTPEEIKTKLDTMIGKIINKTPWGGTPLEIDPQGLHLFYSHMLTNFEGVVSTLTKADSPAKKAGPLISIAKVELEGRCAAAYQAEIEQAKMLQDPNTEEAGLETNFNKLARASLLDSIETIVRRDYNGDSHDFSQMLFSVGMAPSADPLTPVTVADCLEKIKAEWTRDRLVSSLTEMIGRINGEQLHDWFRSFTPEDFRQDFRIKQVEIEQAEKEIIHDTKDHLKQKGLEDSLCDSALTIFQSTQGTALGLSSRPRKFVSDAVFDRLNQATTLDEVKEAQALLSEENKSDRLKKIEIMDKEEALKEKSALDEGETKLLDDLRKERNALTLKSMEITSEFNTLKLNAETRIKLGELLKVQNPSLYREELDIIVTEKKIFDDKIRALADEKEIDFSPIETGLPSRGIEYQRRIAYAAQFFTEKDEILKLNKRGTTDILLHIGVLENVDLVH